MGGSRWGEGRESVGGKRARDARPYGCGGDRATSASLFGGGGVRLGDRLFGGACW